MCSHEDERVCVLLDCSHEDERVCVLLDCSVLGWESVCSTKLFCVRMGECVFY